MLLKRFPESIGSFTQFSARFGAIFVAEIMTTLKKYTGFLEQMTQQNHLHIIKTRFSTSSISEGNLYKTNIVQHLKLSIFRHSIIFNWHKSLQKL